MLTFAVASFLLTASPLPADQKRPAFGVRGGVAYTPEDDFDGIGWTIAGFAHYPIGRLWTVRGTAGAAFLEAAVNGRQPNANYGFLTADFVAADLFSLTGGGGLYYAMVQEPLVDDASYELAPGLNAGFSLTIPYQHRHWITCDLTVHRVFSDGPLFFVALTGGIIF